MRGLSERLARGIGLATGPFRFRIRISVPVVTEGLQTLYARFPVDDGSGLHDFHVSIDRVGGPRRWLRPQVTFRVDGHEPFKPLPADHAFALLEWGMNWCIASQAHHYLLLHAAVLERHGTCVILSGEPGAGKSTLAAALMLSGWRLLSDEITVIDRDDGHVRALARPVSLKNASIDVIRGFAPEAVLGRVARDTHKGSVSHLQPTPDSVARMDERSKPGHIVFPRYQAGSPTLLDKTSKAGAMVALGNQSFNYGLLGRVGFELAADLVDLCECWSFTYSRLDQAVATFERWTR